MENGAVPAKADKKLRPGKGRFLRQKLDMGGNFHIAPFQAEGKAHTGLGSRFPQDLFRRLRRL